MKFDMSRAWNEAMAILRANGGLMAVIAGLFVFLPNLAMTMLAPATMSGPPMEGDETPEQMLEIMGGFYGEVGPWMLALSIIGLIGSLAMYALVTTARPTVGEALKTGLLAFVPAILAQILMGVAVGVVGAVLIGLPFVIGLPALAVLTIPIFAVLLIYIIVKLTLTSPVIVIEGVRNPIAALQRSWRLTKGNSLRLFGFYFILLICIFVVMAVFAMFSSLFIALLGEGTAGLLVAGILNGVISAAFAVLGVGILSAVHRQLAGPTPQTVSETFE